MKFKKATAILCAFTTILSGNCMTANAEDTDWAEKNATNFGYSSEDEIDWDKIDWNKIPFSERLNFYEKNIWGEDIVYPLNTSNEDVTVTYDDSGETTYEWDIPATEVVFMGGEIFSSNEYKYVQQLVFGEKIEKAFHITLRTSDFFLEDVKIQPNFERNSDKDIVGYVLPDGMNISYDTRCFNNRFGNDEIMEDLVLQDISATKFYDNDIVTYSFPRIIEKDWSFEVGLTLGLDANKNMKEYEGSFNIFGKTFDFSKYLVDPEPSLKGKTFNCLIDGESFDSWREKFAKFYNVTETFDETKGNVTFDFTLDKDRVITFQNSFFLKAHKYRDDFEAYENCKQEMAKAFKDAVTIEISTCSEKVAGNIVSAFKNDNSFYDGIGHCNNSWDFNEENLSVETYDDGEKTYYRIKYCPLNDEEIERCFEIKDTRYVFEELRNSDLSFTIPLSRLIEEDWFYSEVLVGVPYDFYDDTDFYDTTLEEYFFDASKLEDECKAKSVKGDINGDTRFNIADLLVLNEYLLGEKMYYDYFNRYAVDVNNDGAVNVFDMVALKIMYKNNK